MTDNLGENNIYVTCGETILCGFNLIRIYLCWRVLRDWILSVFPKHQTLSGFQRTKIGSSFAIKHIMHRFHLPRRSSSCSDQLPVGMQPSTCPSCG